MMTHNQCAVGTERRQYVDKEELMHRRLWCLVIHSTLAAAKRDLPYARDWFTSPMFFSIAKAMNLNVEILQLAASSPVPLAEEPNNNYVQSSNEKWQAQLTPDELRKRRREWNARHLQKKRGAGGVPTVLPVVTVESNVEILQQVNDGY